VRERGKEREKEKITGKEGVSVAKRRDVHVDVDVVDKSLEKGVGLLRTKEVLNISAQSSSK